MKFTKPILGLVIVGMCSGAYYAGTHSNDAVIAAKRAERARLALDHIRALAEPVELEIPATDPDSPGATTLAETPASRALARSSLLAELRERKLIAFKAPIVANKGNIDPALSALLELSDAERDAFQQAIDIRTQGLSASLQALLELSSEQTAVLNAEMAKAKEAVLQMEATNRILTRADERGVVVTIPSCAEGDGALRQAQAYVRRHFGRRTLNRAFRFAGRQLRQRVSWLWP